MCGRSRNTLNRQQVAAAARVAPERWRNADSFQPSYNLPPGRDAPVVKRAEDGQLEVQTMRWGLVPSWTKKGTKPDHFRMFNARSETVAEKSVFSRLLSRQRCIFLAEGFYEWKKDGSKKQPYYIHMGEERPLQMAGLYDVWHNEDGNALHTFTLLTTDSSKRLRWLHDRMPVLLTTPEAQGAWLAQEINLKGLTALAVPYSGEDLVWHEVTPQMGSAQFQGPDCCKPLKKGPGIAAFFKKPAAGKLATVAAEAATPSPAAATAGKGGGDAAAADTAAPDEAAAGVKLEDGASAAQPGSGRQDGSSDARPASAVNAEQASLQDGRTDGAAAPAGSIEPEAGAAAPGRQPGGERPGAGTGGLVKQEDDVQQPAVEAANPDYAGAASALPLNPDDKAGEVKQEEEQQHSQPAAADAPQPTPPAPTRKKRPAGADASAAKSPGDSKRAKKGATPGKGQKTMSAFFAVK